LNIIKHFLVIRHCFRPLTRYATVATELDSPRYDD
jgi:hypothetical protein